MQNRLLSLDVFRGLTVAAMILVNNPGDWGHVYAPLLHAEWHGCTPTDLIFPFFLFIAGVSIVFAMGKNKPSVFKIAKRSAILFGLGLFLSLYPKFEFGTVRIMGVLQRIGLVFFICSLVFLYTTRKTQIWLTVGILVGYCLLMTYVPVPDVGYPNLAPETNMGAWLDRLVLTPDHLWKKAKVWDPEGLLGTLPAVATGLLGVLTGQWLKTERAISERMTWLFLAGNALIIIGLIWDLVFPVNKALWTSSYVCYAGGWAMVGLAICYWLIDVQGYRSFTTVPLVFGVNAITVFFLSGVIPRTMSLIQIDGKDAKTYLYESFIAPLFANAYNASLAGALIFLAIWFVILYLMYKQKIFVKV
ncbi:MAG: heparan-alpha-glucosaminide N-acetyltransferase domain-containing protein [Spirosomaceae bacterium]|jgi:predicted acyltransferase|nr:heparan-alpha-glucosaminide N-acetyltransferase domain-containing protein [Spirosomataceae bacterium]